VDGARADPSREEIDVPAWAWAGFWGGVAGSALLIGAAIGFYAQVPSRIVAAVMAFGGGVLVSALSFDLVDEAYRQSGAWVAGSGFLGGALIFTLGTWALNHHGARNRKRSNTSQPSEADQPGSGMVLALGALIDGIPESIAIGVSLIAGGAVSAVAVAAVFLSNVPEGLSSAAGMRHAGRSSRYVFGVWAGIAIASAVAALLGYVVFRGLPQEAVAATIAIAGGAILAMLADTMMPEAYEHAHDAAGLITVAGFLIAFLLSKLQG
jgi:ZIP family zinc transporter